MITNPFRRYPLSIILVAVIWCLCMFAPPETPLSEVAYIDKWTHLVMYGGFCSVIWFEYLLRHRNLFWHRIVTWAIISPIVMSGIIELAQAYCTTTRSGEWLDFAVNTLGAILGNILGYYVLRPLVWHCKRTYRS